MTEWFADPAYLGTDDKPLSVPLHARGPSLAKLIHRALPDDDPEQVALALVNARAVRQQGRLYSPISRYVSFSEDLANAQAHSLASLRGHVCTVQHNVSCADPNRRLFERQASNLHIPLHALPEIHRRLQREGTAFLFAMDSFLQEFQVRPGSEPTTCVGIATFAYEDPMVTATKAGNADASTAHGPGTGSGAAPAEAQALTETPPLHPTVTEAIERFVRVLDRFGISQADFVSCIRQEYFRLDKGRASSVIDPDEEIPAAADALTVWWDDALYLDARGQPRGLRRRGPAPSFHSLMSGVDSEVDPDRVLAYLERCGAVRRVGTRYVAVKRLVLLRGLEGPTIARSLRGIASMLRTTEHNLVPETVAPGWLERTCENARVPASKLSDWATFLEREAMGFLGRADAFLRTCELERQPGEPTVATGAGVYRYEDEPPQGNKSDRMSGAVRPSSPRSPRRPRSSR